MSNTGQVPGDAEIGGLDKSTSQGEAFRVKSVARDIADMLRQSDAYRAGDERKAAASDESKNG